VQRAAERAKGGAGAASCQRRAVRRSY
jgi:hypothetical protein